MATNPVHRRVLEALSPALSEEQPTKWQQRKSRKTRQRLLDAGMDCLVEGGYAGLTTAAVAERCALSRGAMHHHFPTRIDLVAAVAEHVLYRRMHRFLDDYFTALGEAGGEFSIGVAAETHWQSLHTREYAAYVQLVTAARSDDELAGHFDPVARRFDEVWTSEMIEAFPQWRQHWDVMKLASDFTYSVHLGMMLHEPVFGRGERMDRVRDLVIQTIEGLYRSVGTE